MSTPIAIHWFRQDLRLQDNPALTCAAAHQPVLPIYILDTETSKQHTLGSASRCWLHHSLTALNDSLGGHLSVYQGQALDIIRQLIERFNVKTVCWNSGYEAWQIEQESLITEFLETKNISIESHNASLLWEPWQIKKKDGTPYKIFTPFYTKGCLNAVPVRKPLPKPKRIDCLHDQQSITIQQLDLLPHKPWGNALTAHWHISEQGAHDRFQTFIKEGLLHYQEGRNFPAQPYVSRLSPYLHFGQISPHQLWHSVQNMEKSDAIDTFCRELAWREFSYNLLYYNPTLPQQNLQKKFDAFPWLNDPKKFKFWQQGKTGIPIVDAGMRELWQTGYMHNRVRMIVASFLVKNLKLHWHHGAHWFWDTLVDADLANNSASWQWVAGCGTDAAPYFRIFNPVTQSQKFDPEGHYIRQFVPEITLLPNKYLFSPWLAPKDVLKNAKIELGQTYPHPIVDLQQSRKDALTAFQSLKKP